jgi:hypothetical protein
MVRNLNELELMLESPSQASNQAATHHDDRVAAAAAAAALAAQRARPSARSPSRRRATPAPVVTQWQAGIRVRVVTVASDSYHDPGRR